MATILKVHGTFASGPEEGDKWWQRGSECCSHVGELVEAEDGHLKIEQVIWDGLNSERSRQNAAAKLLDRMGELEKAGEPYCVVGHSHGGSVISAALLRAAFYKRPLDKLSRWITIGTPFIEAKRSRLLFSRLGPGGKTAFLSVLSFFAAAMLMGAKDNDPNVANVSDNLGTVGFVIAMLVLLALCYPVLWLLARNRLHWHDRRAQDAASKSYTPRWFPLRHEDDEAVQGLRAFQTIKHPIFPRDFAVNPLSRFSILLVPLAIYLTLTGLSSLQGNRDGQPAPAAQSTSAPSKPEPSPPAAKAGALDKAAERPSSGTGSTNGWVVAIALLVIPGIFIGIPMAMYYLLNWAARPTSIALSHGLNAMSWSQIRRSSLGSDIDGEIGRHARDHPLWIDKPTRPLPQALAAEISSVSDAAAANSIAKFRAALSELAFYRIQDGGRDAFNAFLTGDELIHTAYFKIPRFRKLLAYSIAQSPGFRPSAALRNDPELPLIEQWYKELTAAAQPAPPLPAPATPA